ncbi:MAG: hypothetical protein ACTHLA_14925 [Asticcacaulis sp.]|uniref:hypothetical protein n=1 Tax=Asticcacaulis sp. TaxID=1872648 RepID=UPI003F7BA728
MTPSLSDMKSAASVKPQPPEDLAAIKPLPELAVDEKAVLQVSTQPASLQMPQLVAPTGMASNEGGRSGNSGDDLWSAIAPCWKRLADKDTQAVTLEVSFSDNGGLSAPPVIERDPGASQDPKTLRSEATALAALSQCGNYAMVGGKKDLKINFPKP